MPVIRNACMLPRSRYMFINEAQFDSLNLAVTRQLDTMANGYYSALSVASSFVPAEECRLSVGPTLSCSFPEVIPPDALVYLNPLLQSWKRSKIGASLLVWSNVGNSDPAVSRVASGGVRLEVSLAGWLMEWMYLKLGFAQL